jgi:hypothetical protein
MDTRQQLDAALKTEAHLLFMSPQTRDLRNSGGHRFVFGCGTSGADAFSDSVVLFISSLLTGLRSSTFIALNRDGR